ncbi:hypothetical protein AMK68_04900 [candidate division KD3-62 bacterium DG_56]|uniref:Uncharacterized protein n=1 Tax=candidate division KD3-62 bacterium DG_56 TaxID=1704032 RepID=A0A0S7XJ07_9BACT|nr:MAG: hypothetical protein AMK68_04900 [candidate division KD3-62 bacterium DG_56]
MITLLAAWAAALLSPAAGETLVQEITFESPGLSWSDVMLPWGGGGFLDWTIADGGNPGKALRITTKENKNPVSCENRTLMFNHQPGTPVRVEMDVNPVTHPKGSVFMIRWFDGYVTAEAFERIADDEFEPWPAPAFTITETPQEPGWKHVDFRTSALDRTVFTLLIVVRQPPDPAKETQDEFINYYIDNLRVETTPLAKYMDPGFDWHGKGGGKMIEWRQSIGGRHVDWCDFMDDVVAPLPNGGTIEYTMQTFRDTGAAPRPGHGKHDYSHEVHNNIVGGASTITLSRIHPGEVPCAWGVRQTVSYAAFGLEPDQDAHIEILVKYTLHDPAKKRLARLQVGADPEGGVVTENALWSEEDAYANWDVEGWRKAKLEFDRPKGAVAFTVFFRHRDGDRTGAERQTIRATDPGNRAIADWIMITATKK